MAGPQMAWVFELKPCEFFHPLGGSAPPNFRHGPENNSRRGTEVTHHFVTGHFLDDDDDDYYYYYYFYYYYYCYYYFSS